MRTNYVAVIQCRSHEVPRNGSIHLAPQLHGQVWGNGVEARRFANVAAGLLHTGRVQAYAPVSLSRNSCSIGWPAPLGGVG
jgi:hypothetical protein